jgi:trans-aconitate methyltransferase
VGDEVCGEKLISHQIDPGTPSVARMHDYLLGGIENFPSDRAVCADLLRLVPSAARVARDSRGFLSRVVRVLAEEYGVRQFLDHGAGIPTRRNVHQIAQDITPDARVVYIDTDPLVLAHGRMILDENDNVAVIDADIRDTESIFNHPQVRRLINPAEPVAALFVSVLHYLPDASDPGGLLARVADRLAPGSFLAICALVSDNPQTRDSVTRLMTQATNGRWGRVRERREVAAYVADRDLIPPGLTDAAHWHPETAATPRAPADDWAARCAVARL